MKRALVAIFALTALLCCSVPSSAEILTKENGYINVNLSTVKEISPDQAEINLSIETTDKTIQKAVEENKNIANNVYAALKAILEKDDYIKTSNYSVKPQYIYTKDNKKIFDKYMVINSITIKTKNIENISKIIDTGLSKGANKVENLNFSAVDYDSLCNQTIAELAKKAYAQADSIAKAINSQITGIKAISANCNTEGSSRNYYGVMMAKGGSEEGTTTPVESGKIKININLNASFYTK